MVWIISPYFKSTSINLASTTDPNRPILTTNPNTTPVSPASQYSATMEILFSENFDSGIAQGFRSLEGDWQVINGMYTSNPKPPEYYATCSIVGQLNWSDYRVEADFINSNNGAILVRTQDINNWVSFCVSPMENGAYWQTRKNGNVSDVINDVFISNSPNSNLHLAVEVTGDWYYGYINGELITLMELADFPNGKIALSMSAAQQNWDNLMVYRIAPKSAPAPSAIAAANENIKSTKYNAGFYDIVVGVTEQFNTLRGLSSNFTNYDQISVEETIRLFNDMSQKLGILYNRAMQLDPPSSMMGSHYKFLQSVKYFQSSLDSTIKAINENGIIPESAYDNISESYRLWRESMDLYKQATKK